MTPSVPVTFDLFQLGILGILGFVLSLILFIYAAQEHRWKNRKLEITEFSLSTGDFEEFPGEKPYGSGVQYGIEVERRIP